MHIDAQAQEVLDQFAKYAVPPIETLTPLAARNLPVLDYAVRDLIASKVAARLLTVVTPAPEPVSSISHEIVPGPGGDLLLRVYKPNGEAPLPVLVYFHGGGGVIGNVNSCDASARALCHAAGSIVVSVAYRQAPEHPFPAAIEDAYAATQWVSQNAQMFSGDTTHVAVGGEGLGGTLATVACLRANVEGGALPVHQLLIYPVTNWSFKTPSYLEHANAKPLSAAVMPWFKRHYLTNAADALNPWAAPLLAPSLSGLPPATVITADNDPLRDDGRLYAERLQKEGVPVTYQNFEGMMHEFFSLGIVVDKAREAVRLAARELQAAFGTAA